MKKRRYPQGDEPAAEYDFSDGVRGKYAAQFAEDVTFARGAPEYSRQRTFCVHIFYEADMMQRLAIALSKKTYGLRRNAYLESFLIHARALIEFFFAEPNPRFPDDLRAQDYFDDPSRWKEARDKRAHAALFKVEEVVGYQIAHLNWKRIVGAGNAWDVAAIATALSSLLRCFVSFAASDRLDPSCQWEILSDRFPNQHEDRSPQATAHAPLRQLTGVVSVQPDLTATQTTRASERGLRSSKAARG